MISRIHLPIQRPGDVINHLGAPTHWQPGRSAKLAADCWFASNAIPPVVASVLAGDPVFAGAELLDAFLERCVDLGDGERPSQTDVMAIARIDNGIGVLAVEAKVDETFGPTVAEWLEDKKGDGSKKSVRLCMLCDLLGLDPTVAGDLRYQLLHRTASAVIEARRYRTTEAAMVVHSFCPKRSWFEDFRAFATAIGVDGASPGSVTAVKSCGGVNLRLGWASDPVEGPFERLRTPRSVVSLTELGRTQLSRSFFMREMLYSEVAMIHGLNNAPDFPDLAVEAGKRLCGDVLEPLQERWGRIAIRSAYRSREVNGFCNEMQRKGKSGYTCASNEDNYARHIWDHRDAIGCMGAVACVVVPGFWEQHQEPGDWRIMARWIHENLPYSELEFFPFYWAFNVGWHERPARTINSYAEPRGKFTP
jgi:hypothetical protein